MSALASPRPRGYAYRTPGVHFEWLDRPRAVAELRTDVAGFVGIAARGPLNRALRITSWTQFTSTFGAHTAAGYLAYAVEAFFANGGRTCWVVRVANPDPAVARSASLTLYDDWAVPTLRLEAASPGTWAHDVTATVTRVSTERFALTIRTGAGERELWRNLSLDPTDARFALDVLNGDGGSALVRAQAFGPTTAPSARGQGLTAGTARLNGGGDGLATLEPRHLTGEDAPPNQPRGLGALRDVDEVAIVAIPDAMAKPWTAPPRRPPAPPSCADPRADEPAAAAVSRTEPGFELPPRFDDRQLRDLQLALLRHCAELKDRFAILDGRPEDTSPERILAWRRSFDPSAEASAYGALYHPWILAPDPARIDGSLRAVPPSGHIAGIYARSDLRVGVHKPPANERLENTAALVADTNDATHGYLNEAGVNVLRTLGARLRVAGARTLSGDTAWRYVNVRRLVSMIEEAIAEATDWTVFEPNAPALWREIDRLASSFLDGLWKRGMLDGATPDEAYLVRCDESTNPPEALDRGRMTCLIGVLPPWPAEFVIVRIGATVGAAPGVPDAEAQNG